MKSHIPILEGFIYQKNYKETKPEITTNKAKIIMFVKNLKNAVAESNRTKILIKLGLKFKICPWRKNKEHAMERV